MVNQIAIRGLQSESGNYEDEGEAETYVSGVQRRRKTKERLVVFADRRRRGWWCSSNVGEARGLVTGGVRRL